MGSSSDGDEVAVRAAASCRSPRILCRRRGGEDAEDDKPASSPPKEEEEEEEEAARSAATIDGGARGGKKLLNLVFRALTAALLAALAATALLSSSSSSPTRRSGPDGSSPSSSSSLLFDPAFDPATGLTLPPPSIWDAKAKSPSGKPNTNHNYSSLREEAREWFASTFDLYLEHAFPRDDLKPLSCSGSDSQGGIALTRIDAMTTALMLGEVERLEGTVAWASRGKEPAGSPPLEDGGAGKGKPGKKNSSAGGGGSGGGGSSSSFSSPPPLLRFDNKHGARVHVFELTIRAVGSLVSSHIYLKRQGSPLPKSSFSPSSPPPPPRPLRTPSYDGFSLLNKAVDLAERLLPAFGTPSGVPLSWVHLTEEGGVPLSPQDEKDRSTCAACAGTLLLEFAALSRESGDARFELAAARAARALHSRRSRKTGLVGNTIDVDSGSFIRRDSGVGAGIDSYYEYLLKSYLLTGQKEWLVAFVEAYTSAMRHCSPPIVLMLEKEKAEEGEEEEEESEEGEEKGRKKRTKFALRPRRKAWRVDSHVDTAAMTRPWISSLGAFWPGLQALAGQTVDASKSHADWAAAWLRFDGLPEALDVSGVARHPTLTGYPLRPELVESSFVLFGETRHEAYLATGAAVMETLRNRCRAECGFAALADVGSADGGRSDFSMISSSSTSSAAAAATTAATAKAASQQQDAMDSFFLSETVKYLWLLFFAADAEEGGGEAGVGVSSTARLLDAVVLTTEGHPLPPYPLSTEEEEEEAGSSSSSPSSSSSSSSPAACSRLCSLSEPSSSSSLSISRSLSAAMPLLAPTERDVETLRRRRCAACLAVEEAMLPVRVFWAQETQVTESAAAAAMVKAERAAAAMKAKTKTSSGGSSLARASSSSSSSPLSSSSLDQDQLELILQQQQQQQIQEQRQLLQQLQFFQQQQQQQRPPVAQVLCRLLEVVSSPSSPSSSSSSSSSSRTEKSITCGSLSLVPRDQMPIKPELVPAETLVLQIVQAGEEEAAADAAAGEETCPAGDGDDGDENSTLPLPPREWRFRLRVSSSEDRRIPPLSLSGYSAEFGPSLASAAECKSGGGGGGGDGSSDGSENDGRPCSVSGFLVAARPANACSSSVDDDLTFEPPVPPGRFVVVVVERGNCDFEAKVSAVARALPSSRRKNSSTVTAAAAAAVVVLSGEDAHLSMGRSLVFSPDFAKEEPPIPSMLLPKSQAERLRAAMARAGQFREAVAEREARRKKEKKSEEEEADRVLLTAELRAMPERTTTKAEQTGSGGSGPPPPLEVATAASASAGGEEGDSSAPFPNRGTVTISALAPAAAAWLDERDVSSGSGGSVQSETSGGSGSSFVNGTLLQQLLMSVAQSREFGALLQQVAREKQEEEGKGEE